WEVTLDRELAYRAQGVAPLREPDVVVTVTWWERRPPKWLARRGEGFPRYDVYVVGMRRLVPTPGAPRASARMRLSEWADALEA
ncbi:MAG: hypothetical protein ACYC8T_20200, partial [Myxococcaceae bacterium]